MKTSTFIKAKNLNERIDKLSRYKKAIEDENKNNLEIILHDGSTNYLKDDLILGVKERIKKNINSKLEILMKEFEEL